MKIENILQDGIGQIELIDFLGGDLNNVNGARASFATKKEVFDNKDARLIARLGGDIHHTPLRHTYVQLAVEAPEFVARQWYKHVVGSEYAFKDLPWSEFSQRYKEVEPKFYVPQEIRGQSDTNKQASVAARLAFVEPEDFEDEFLVVTSAYRHYIDSGVAREQARIVLPLATYTSWVWTASLQAVVHFCALRDEPGAQWEIQQYAKALKDIVRPLAPVSWEALEKNHPMSLKKDIKRLETENEELRAKIAELTKEAP